MLRRRDLNKIDIFIPGFLLSSLSFHNRSLYFIIVLYIRGWDSINPVRRQVKRSSKSRLLFNDSYNESYDINF